MTTANLVMEQKDWHVSTFRPDRKGLRKVLGDLEADIMDIVWAWGTATVRQVHNRLNKDRPLAYTTVMTVMSRLADKGILNKDKAGAAFVYKPSTTRDAFMESAVREVITGLLGDFSTPAINQFVASIETVYPEKLNELAKLVAERHQPLVS